MLFVGMLTGAIITCVVAVVHGEDLCCCEVGASGSLCWYGLVWKLGGRGCKRWIEHASVAGFSQKAPVTRRHELDRDTAAEVH